MDYQTPQSRDFPWSSFHEKLDMKPERITERISILDQMLEDIISDYKAHGNVHRSYQLIIKLEKSTKLLSDELNYCSLEPAEAQALTDLQRRLIEESALMYIRDTDLNERLYEESIMQLPHAKPNRRIASLPGHAANSTVKKPLHSKTTSDVMMIEKNNSHHKQEGSPDAEKGQGKWEEEKQDDIKLHEGKVNKGDALNKDTNVMHDDNRIEIENETSWRKSIDSLNVGDIKDTKQIDDLFTKMEGDYREHRIEFANKFLIKIRELAAANKLDNEQRDYLNKKLEENKLLLEDVECDYQYMADIIGELDNETGYQIEKAKKDIVVKYKNLPNGGVAIKFEATVNVPLFNLLALNYEAEGYAQWTPFCSKSKLIKRLARNSNAMWMKWVLPPPVSAREGYLIGSGYDRLDTNGSIVMVAKTIHKDERTIQRYELDVPTKAKHTRMEIPYIGTELIPLTETRTKMRLVTTFDPKIPFVPMSLIGWIARKGAIYMLDTIVKTASKLQGSTWEKNLEKSPDFYNWLRNLLDDHFKKQKEAEKDAETKGKS